MQQFWNKAQNMQIFQGRRPRGTGGTVPPNMRWGTAHASVPPIFWEVVLPDVRDSLNRVKKGAFLVRKGSYTTFCIVQTRKMCEKKGKIRKTRSMTKRRSSKIFAVKMEIFSEKNVIQKSWSAKKFSVPPNSAPLRFSRIIFLLRHPWRRSVASSFGTTIFSARHLSGVVF